MIFDVDAVGSVPFFGRIVGARAGVVPGVAAAFDLEGLNGGISAMREEEAAEENRGAGFEVAAGVKVRGGGMGDWTGVAAEEADSSFLLGSRPRMAARSAGIGALSWRREKVRAYSAREGAPLTLNE